MLGALKCENNPLIIRWYLLTTGYTTGWLGWSGRIKAIMTGKCQGQPEQFSWVDDLSHFCYKSGQVRYGQLTVFGITAV